MASKQTYECYVCKRSGFPDTRVYLDGKTDDDKTIYKNPDMAPHIHKSSNNSSTVSGKTPQTNESVSREIQQTDTSSTNALLKIIIAELQRLIKLFEKEEQQQQQNHK